MNLRRSVGASVVALLVGAAMVGLTAPARAQDDAGGTFSGIAAADAVRVNAAIPNYLLIEDFVDGGGPSAQAALDSLGVSRAFSSFPYPGELGVAATGLVSTLTGFSLPSYPLIANSDFPVQPERNIDQPGLHLTTKSDPTSSSAGAAFGESAGASVEGGGFATAEVTTDDAMGVVARSEARFSLVLGPVALRGVQATAMVTRSRTGELERTSSLTVGQISIGGVAIELTDRGLVVAGAPLVPFDAITGLSQALTLGATKIEFLPAVQSEDSVLSAGLQISTSLDLPAVGHPLNVTYRLGNVFAQADGSAFESDAVPSLPLADEVLAPVDLGGSPTFEAPAGLDAPTAPGGTPVAGAPTAARRQVGDLVSISSWTFFPILALAALALLAGTLGERWQHSRDSRGGS